MQPIFHNSATALLIGLLLLPIVAIAAKFEVSVDQDSVPSAFQEGGEVRGIFPDLLTEIIEKRMGIPVEFSAYPWGRAQQLVREGVHDGMVTNPTDARLEYADASTEVLYEAPLVPLTKRASPAATQLIDKPSVETLRDLRFCHGKASGWHTAFAEQNDLDTHGVTDSEACVRMINGERMDVTVYAEDMLLWDVRNLGLQEELEIVEVPFGVWNLTLMVSKQSDFATGFLPLFDQTVADMKADGSYDRVVETIHTRYR